MARLYRSMRLNRSMVSCCPSCLESCTQAYKSYIMWFVEAVFVALFDEERAEQLTSIVWKGNTTEARSELFISGDLT